MRAGFYENVAEGRRVSVNHIAMISYLRCCTWSTASKFGAVQDDSRFGQIGEMNVSISSVRDVAVRRLGNDSGMDGKVNLECLDMRSRQKQSE
jgi:hypothetical protein